MRTPIVHVRSTLSVLTSKDSFTYDAAQRRKDDKSLNEYLTEGIHLLNKRMIQLQANRIKAGALNLASLESSIHMQSAKSSDPADVDV